MIGQSDRRDPVKLLCLWSPWTDVWFQANKALPETVIGLDSCPQGQLTAMQRRQSAMESELAAVRSAAEQTKQQLQARIIVLETRLRAWKGVCHIHD